MTRAKPWRSHDPLRRPLGCNGRPGDSGRQWHRRQGTDVCGRCREASNHARREARRGQPYPTPLYPCGTQAAAQRHRRNSEPVDLACAVADAADSAERYAKKKKTGDVMGKPWDLTHDPFTRPLGCNGKPGDSGRNVHRRRGEPNCDKCRAAANHLKREANRGQPHPRPKQGCGTPAAAKQHRLRNEPLDYPCKIAENHYKAEWRAKKNTKAAPNRAASSIPPPTAATDGARATNEAPVTPVATETKPTP